MTTDIHTSIREKMKEAMKTKDSVSLETYRGLLTMFTNEAVATGKTPQDMLDDAAAMGVIKRAVKQRKDSIDQFRKGGREDLAQKEEAELNVLTPLLPTMMSEEEIRKIAEAKKAELSIDDKSKMGMLMGAVMKETGGNADGGDVKKVVESLF